MVDDPSTSGPAHPDQCPLRRRDLHLNRTDHADAGTLGAAREYDGLSLRHKGTDSRTLGEHFVATNVAQTVRFMGSGCLNFSQDRQHHRNIPRSGTERGQRSDYGQYGGSHRHVVANEQRLERGGHSLFEIASTPATIRA